MVSEIRNPYNGEVIGCVPLVSRGEVVSAIDAAVKAAPAAAALPSYQRAAILHRIRSGLLERKEELSEILAAEAGKPLALARTELDRAIFVFEQGAEEAKRIGGEMMPMDLMPHGEGRWGLTRRFPLSPIAAITPFNFPVLLAAHKLAPAIACGATMVLKPPPQDPLTTMKLGEIVSQCGYPEGAITIVPCTNDGCRAAAGRSPNPDDQFHRFRPGGMDDSPARTDQARSAGAGRQCRGHDRARRRPGPCREALCRRRLPLCRPILHFHPAHPGPRSGL